MIDEEFDYRDNEEKETASAIRAKTKAILVQNIILLAFFCIVAFYLWEKQAQNSLLEDIIKDLELKDKNALVEFCSRCEEFKELGIMINP